MKTNTQQKTIHQHLEQFMRHEATVGLVVVCMLLALIGSDTRFRNMLRQAYAQGWGLIGTYLRHEHPSHSQTNVAIARIPTISSAK